MSSIQSLASSANPYIPKLAVEHNAPRAADVSSQRSANDSKIVRGPPTTPVVPHGNHLGTNLDIKV